VDGEVTNAEDHTNSENNVFYDQGKIGLSHLLRGQISKDWATVINDERIESGIKSHPRASVKVVREIILIVLDLWRRQCEILFGKTKEAKIKNKRDHLTKKIDKLRGKKQHDGKGKTTF
jgi:hypothetical protein